MKHELFEELEAFDPKWQQHYNTLRDAARAANALNLFEHWLENTTDGLAYIVNNVGIPDYSIKRSSGASSLPYSLDNIGEVPDNEPDEIPEAEFADGYSVLADGGAAED